MRGSAVVDRVSFERLVEEALASLPDEFLDALENIEVVVEDWPSEQELEEAGLDPRKRYALLGLYHGVPLPERGTWYAGVGPDLITIYQKPIERIAGGDPEAIRKQVRTTVLHEIAHYFGIDDERLAELGWC